MPGYPKGNDPVPLAAVQAAVLKSAAGAAGQSGEPPPSTGGVFEGAIAQDLAVMADQAKSYSAGAAAGNVEAENQRSMQSNRLSMEAAQAAAARARQAEMDRMSTSEAGLRAQRETQANALRLAELDRAVGVERVKAGKKDNTDEQERVAEVRRRLLHEGTVKVSPDFAAEFEELLSGAVSFKEFKELLDALAGTANYPTLGTNRLAAERYARTFYDAASGKSVNVDTRVKSRGSFLTEMIHNVADARR